MKTLQPIQTPAPNDSLEGLDLNYLHMISGGDKDFERDMLQSLSVEMSEKMGALNTAIQTGDVKAVRMQAHSLKNLANIVGVSSLAERFKNIEAGCEEANFNYVLQQYQPCERQWDYSRGLIGQLLHSQ